ncbi:antibiotic biosynthesis monooxygenase [Herbaspirillum sp. BH-1]|uniref:antibiotic biosynthesis monooxygenase family protein n=1 Tax=Herbaspirillum sp. (strain BH-1) TaxID=2058884 RepID=UPI003518F7E4
MNGPRFAPTWSVASPVTQKKNDCDDCRDWPAQDKVSSYFDIAAPMRPALELIDGFISNERFESLAAKGKYLSLPFWRDHDAVREWRDRDEHRHAQSEERHQISESRTAPPGCSPAPVRAAPGPAPSRPAGRTARHRPA